MATIEEFSVPLEERWNRYTVEQLVESSHRLSRAARRVAAIRLALSAVAAGILVAADLATAALVAAIVGTGFGLAAPLGELVFQSKLAAGGIGMLVEETRAIHAFLRIRAEM